MFNLALPSAGQVIDITKKLSRPGPVRVLCDAHPHMFAWVYVHDSPYVAVTDERGAFASPASPGHLSRHHVARRFRPRGIDKDGRPLYDEPQRVTGSDGRAPGYGHGRVRAQIVRAEARHATRRAVKWS